MQRGSAKKTLFDESRILSSDEGAGEEFVFGGKIKLWFYRNFLTALIFWFFLFAIFLILLCSASEQIESKNVHDLCRFLSPKNEHHTAFLFQNIFLSTFDPQYLLLQLSYIWPDKQSDIAIPKHYVIYGYICSLSFIQR